MGDSITDALLRMLDDGDDLLADDRLAALMTGSSASASQQQPGGMTEQVIMYSTSDESSPPVMVSVTSMSSSGTSQQSAEDLAKALHQHLAAAARDAAQAVKQQALPAEMNEHVPSTHQQVAAVPAAVSAKHQQQLSSLSEALNSILSSVEPSTRDKVCSMDVQSAVSTRLVNNKPEMVVSAELAAALGQQAEPLVQQLQQNLEDLYKDELAEVGKLKGW